MKCVPLPNAELEFIIVMASHGKIIANKGIKADQFGIESTFTRIIHVDGVVWCGSPGPER